MRKKNGWKSLWGLFLLCFYSKYGLCDNVLRGTQHFRGEIVEQVCNLKGKSIFHFEMPVTSTGIYSENIKIELDNCSDSFPKYMMFSSLNSDGDAIFQNDDIQLRIKRKNTYIRSGEFVAVSNFNEFTIEVTNLNKEMPSLNKEIYVTIEYVIAYV